MEFIYKSILGNELWRYLQFFLLILISLLAGKFLTVQVNKLADRVTKDSKDLQSLMFKSLSKPITFISLIVGFKLGSLSLVLSDSISDIYKTTLMVLLAITVGYSFYSLIDIVDYYFVKLAKKTTTKVDDMLYPLIGKSLRITIVFLTIIQTVQFLSNKPITSIIAGLGVGGLAVALAGQDTIKNFFGSLVIVADKPFEINDRIVINGEDGSVEDVGFRSTKIRTLDGHLVTIPNSDVVNSSVRNISKRPNIKHVANITLTYNTPPEKVKEAIKIIKNELHDPRVNYPDFPPRVFFNNFNDWSLNILVIFWFHPPAYWDYLEFVEQFNINILTQFNEKGIEFAFPTQTLYVKNETSNDQGC